MLSPTTLASSSVQIVTIYQMSVMCVMVGSDELIKTARDRTNLYNVIVLVVGGALNQLLI